MVIGIGVHVKQVVDDFAAELRERATSVRIETGATADRAPLLASILEGFERRYARVLAGRADELLQEWETLSALPRGQQVTVDGPLGRCEGRVAGVDDEGALLLDTPAGGRTRVPFGEIVEALRP